MTARLDYAEATQVTLPRAGRVGGKAVVAIRVVRRTPAIARRQVLNHLPDSHHLAERARELALEAELAVNSLSMSGGASNADGLAELRGTCVELAEVALLTLLAAAHEQAALPALPARTE